MAKIPVGKTIGFAYEFTFGHLGAIIALIWVPIIILALISFLPQVLGVSSGAQADLPATQKLGLASWGLFSALATLVLYTMAYQGVAELALGLRAAGANYYFNLDRPVWRLLGAIVLFALLMVLFVLIFAAAVFLIGWLGSSLSKPVSGILAGVAVLAAFVFFVLIAVRLGFLIVPVTVSEGRIDLGRGWTLTYGNFWRIFAVQLAIVLPILAVFIAGIVIIFSKDIPTFIALAKDTSAQAQAVRDAALQRHMPMLLGLQLILMPFSIGLGIGTSVFAYRALTPSTDVFA